MVADLQRCSDNTLRLIVRVVDNHNPTGVLPADEAAVAAEEASGDVGNDAGDDNKGTNRTVELPSPAEYEELGLFEDEVAKYAFVAPGSMRDTCAVARAQFGRGRVLLVR